MLIHSARTPCIAEKRSYEGSLLVESGIDSSLCLLLPNSTEARPESISQSAKKDGFGPSDLFRSFLWRAHDFLTTQEAD
jgi:hypothetical protein